jgi:D-alanyl-D-alanine carboxypeptidase
VKRFPGLLFIATLMMVASRNTWSAEAGAANDVLDALVLSYPEALARHDDAHIYWHNGTAMAATDGKEIKSFKDLLTNASIIDQFRLRYPLGPLAVPPPINADPGRFRNEPFFRKMYGDCWRGEVQRNMVAIAWLPRTWGKAVQATKVNGVAERLKQVSEEIELLPPAIKTAAYPIAGVFSCRTVKDSGRPSMHAYAAAIDLNIKVSDYWLWQSTKGSGSIAYRNRMPQEIIDIFEKHGFIWGGKWYHYDTMHFEYRPELLRVDNTSNAAARPQPAQ